MDFLRFPLFWKYVVKLRSLMCFYFYEDIVWKRTDVVLFLKENPWNLSFYAVLLSTTDYICYRKAQSWSSN